MSLRTKLMLTACLLLVVPLAGYRFVTGTERFLRERQSEAALETARALALALESQPRAVTPPPPRPTTGPVLNVQALAHAPEVDGYAGDWGDLAPGSAVSALPALRTARHGGGLFLLIALARDRAPLTHLRLVLEDAPRFRRAWLLAGDRPGPVSAREVPPATGALAPGHQDSRLRAALAQVPGGLQFEVRVPLELLGPRLALEVLDQWPGRDASVGALRQRMPDRGAYTLLLPPAGLDALLARLTPGDGRRLRVTDTRGRVLAEAGALGHDGGDGWRALLERLLAVDDDGLLGREPRSLALEGPELRSALEGAPAARLRRVSAAGPLVVSAAYPLHRDHRVTGALVLEESTSPVRSLGRQALVELFAVTVLALGLATAALLLVSGRAAARLARLRDLASDAIDSAGRVKGAFRAPPGGDEIGDLGRSFESAVTRLAGYQEYLELLASRLSHELRTPLAVIRTSLDALSLERAAGDDDTPESRYFTRAREGVDRLDDLIRRMSEAARLEQAISHSERQPVDLTALVQAIVSSHRDAWQSPALVARAGDSALWIHGSPELLLQATDKLLANARDFAAPGSDVVVGLERRARTAWLYVENAGSPLPEGDPARLFQSMVSERGTAATTRVAGAGAPHLGLGLYVVRLVAEFHGGRAVAEDLPRGDGVRVGLLLPLAGR